MVAIRPRWTDMLPWVNHNCFFRGGWGAPGIRRVDLVTCVSQSKSCCGFVEWTMGLKIMGKEFIYKQADQWVYIILIL